MTKEGIGFVLVQIHISWFSTDVYIISWLLLVVVAVVVVVVVLCVRKGI